MENGTFEDVYPIKNGDIPASYVSLPEGTIIYAPYPKTEVTKGPAPPFFVFKIWKEASQLRWRPGGLSEVFFFFFGGGQFLQGEKWVTNMENLGITPQSCDVI